MGKIYFHVKNRKTCDFFPKYVRKWLFQLANKVWSGYHFRYFQNIPILKSRDRTNPLTSQLWKLTLPSEKVVRSKFLRGKDEVQVPGTILPLGCAFLNTGAKSVWGFLQPSPLGELGLIGTFYSTLGFDMALQIACTKIIVWSIYDSQASQAV